MQFLEEDDILVPIRVDITHKGCHLIDKFTWNLLNSLCSPEEFAFKICSDSNLPITFIPLISQQIYQQIDSYHILFSLFHNLSTHNQNQKEIVFKTIGIELNIRQNVLEYSDKFQWNPNSLCCTAEKFAQVTCGDLGLPPEMEPAIAFDIRESIVKYVELELNLF